MTKKYHKCPGCEEKPVSIEEGLVERIEEQARRIAALEAALIRLQGWKRKPGPGAAELRELRPELRDFIERALRGEDT